MAAKEAPTMPIAELERKPNLAAAHHQQRGREDRTA
jgi:hypothetical protein